jgi:hypothetical protein
LGGAVASGDVNGDGFADVIVGGEGPSGALTKGSARVWFGNGRGLPRLPTQLQPDGATPLSVLGRSTSKLMFMVRALMRSPAGRARARLEIEAKPLGAPFNAAGLTLHAWHLTSAPGPQGSTYDKKGFVSGLSANTAYHWRARIATRNPFFPHSPWFADNGPCNETKVRTAP